jgi:hypothetical protein
MEDVMHRLATKLTITAAIAALICTAPVSIDLVRPGAAGPQSTARLALALDTAQAHDARVGDDAGARAGAGNRGRAADRRTEPKGNDVRANNIKANDIRANRIDANNVRLNNVKVNDVNATKVDATYVRPPYLARPAAVAATTVAVGTTVAVLPASCTIVDYNGVTYHHCGDTYYIASNGVYVAVNPPR